ncbi:myosin-2 essential light chain-like [Rhopilema esculentum]|uniref:myosin-2 essential light chain-like n=1 Tax=Rhopilema esculentum TaxID=499914 RepID=UPI0031CE8C07
MIVPAMEDEDEDSLEEIQSCFSLFDKRGDMKVESHRVIDVLRSLGLNPLTEDVNKCLKDSNLVGHRIDFPTFYGIFQHICRRPALGTYEDMVEGLRSFDRDQTGLVSRAELRQILLHIGDKMTEEQVYAILAPHEGASGSVSYEALIQTVMH